MEPSSDPFPGGFVSFGKWVERDRWIALGGSLAVHRYHDPTDIPRPHRCCAISPRDSFWALPQSRFCVQSVEIYEPCWESPPFVSRAPGGVVWEYFLFLLFWCGCSKSSILTEAKTRGFVSNNVLIRMFPLITSWCQFSDGTLSFPIVFTAPSEKLLCVCHSLFFSLFLFLYNKCKTNSI